MTSDWLAQLDWHNHDGINRSMINDFVRNQFYDRILKKYVKNQYCTDIGFGTGLLSLIALKHGADRIRAFESDWARFHLGQEIITRCGLQNKIELINERYDRNFQSTPITFTETVNGNLWWEGLWNSLPNGSTDVFLPGQYFLEIWACEIDSSFATGLINPGNGDRFNPGVDLPDNFLQAVNDLSGGHVQPSCVLDTGIIAFERQQSTDWGWIPYMRAAQQGLCVGQYCINQWQPDISSIDLLVSMEPWRDSIVLIVPRVGMMQDEYKMYLDTGHWGPCENPIIVCQPTTDLRISHSLINGFITYNLE